MKRSIFKLWLVGAAVLCGLASCSNQRRADETAGSTPDKSKNLRIATSYKIQNLDPLKSAHYFLIEYGAAETLLTLADDNQLKSLLLESYEQIDELNWRLTLRPNIKFQNGELLTAEKLAAAMNRQLENSPATRAIISGARVKVTGAREVILTTKSSDPNVPAALADEEGFPVYDAKAMETAGNNRDKLITCRCYTGAYQITALSDRELRLEKFAEYWRGTPALDSVTVKFITDPQARILAVQTGEVDIALYPPTQTKRILAGRSDAFFITGRDGRGGPRLFFNVRRSPFDETAVRRAVSLGIDYRALAEEVMDGVFDTATGYYSPLLPWAIQNQKTDIAEAKRLLSESGWGENADGTRSKNDRPLKAVFLVYPQQPDWTTLATAMQAQLRQIGFDIEIRQVEDINQAMKTTSDWNLAIKSPGIMTTGGAPDPSLREFLATGGENNFSGVSDAELDRNIGELSVTFDEAKRAALLRRIQEIVIAEKAYEARPVFGRSRVVVGVNYRNYQPSPLLHHVTFETKPDAD